MQQQQYLITNISRQPLLLVAHHQEVCVRAGVCTCQEGRARAHHLAVGATLRVGAALLGCTDATVALRAGQLLATPCVPPSAAPRAPSPPPNPVHGEQPAEGPPFIRRKRERS